MKRRVWHVVVTFLLFQVPLAAAAPREDSRGGFFDKQKLERGFFPVEGSQGAAKNEKRKKISAAPILKHDLPQSGVLSPGSQAEHGHQGSPTSARPVTAVPASSGNNAAAPLVRTSSPGNLTDNQYRPRATMSREQTELQPPSQKQNPGWPAAAKERATDNERTVSALGRLGGNPPQPSTTRSVLSAVLPADDPMALPAYLRQLAALKRERNVTIGSVLLVESGTFNNSMAMIARIRSKGSPLRVDSARDAALSRYAREAGLTEISINHGNDILHRLRISRFPAWVVRSEGRDYLYEGITNPASLFDMDGRFTGREVQ